MGKQTKLEKIAIEQRALLLPKSYYNSTDGKGYSTTHTRAMSDAETPVNGKGTGKYMDTDNGGGSLDINGVPGELHSGRTSNIAMNEYNMLNGYETPDTSGNIGQIKY